MRGFTISALIILSSFFTIGSKAQTPELSAYFEYDSLINAYAASGEMEPLMAVLQAQIAFIEEHGLTDSLYQYTYKYGKAYIELSGSAAGIEKTEALVSDIIETDSNISHQLHAINDLSWIYIETGNDSMCLVTDLRYLQKCDSYKAASLHEKFMANYSLGFDYEALGKAPKAIFHFKEAIKTVLPDSLNQLENVADGYNGLGASYWRNGNLNKAKQAFSESIRTSQYMKDTLTAYLYQANTLSNLSLVYEDEGDLVKSKEMLERSILIRQKGIAAEKDLYQKEHQTRLLIRNYHNLAALYLTLGDYERSKKAEQHCEKLRKENLPEDHPDHAKSLEAYGSIEFALGNYDNALIHYTKGLEELSEGYGENAPYVITVHQRLGKTYHALGDNTNAQKHFSKAIEALKQMADPRTSQDLAMALLARSKSNYDFGNLEESKSDLLIAENIFKETREKDNHIFGNIYLDMSRIFQKQNMPDSALFYIDKAIAVGYNSDSEQSAKLNNRITYLPHAYAQKARLMSATTNNKAEALDIALKGKSILQQTRADYQEDFSQLALYDQQTSVFDIGIKMAFDLYSTEENAAKYLEIFFQLAEESKSILLRNQLNKFTSLRVNDVPDSLLASENELLKIINGITEGITPDEIFEAEKGYENLLTEFKTNYPTYYKLRYQENVATIAEIKDELLNPNQNLVEYILTDDRAFVIVINAKNTAILELEIADFEQSVAAYNSTITSNSPALQAISKELYAQLFKPLEAYLIGNEIKLIPDDVLYNINFETLINPSHQDQPRYLIYDYTISYLLSSTTALQFANLKNRPNQGVLALAPGFSDELKADYISHLGDSVFIDQQYLSSIQQPFAVMAAQNVASIFPGRALVNAEATEENFKNLANDYSILHLGTHTEINNLSPLLSKFILSKQFENSENQDGYLHAYEIYKLALRAELAVLTACETGLGKNSSEGILSMAHSFAYAGCPSIVMSIWQIDEKSSNEIIGDFYKNLKAGSTKDVALRSAKLKYLKENNSELSHPYYWSGLILVGNVQPIQSEVPFSWFWSLIIVAAVIFLAYLFRKRRNKNA